MAKIWTFLYLLVAFAIKACCQTVQDDWTGPSAPDGATTLTNGSRFTLIWKSSLQNWFKQYCPNCDVRKLDLWVTTFNGKTFQSKIARGIDITTTLSQDWNVDVATTSSSGTDTFVFRFTYFDATDPYTQQISSPGFRVNGLARSSSVVTTSSALRSSSATSSVATTSSSAATSAPSQPGSSATQTPGVSSNGGEPSKNSGFLAGVIVGPIVGIALGAALVWFSMRRRRKSKNEQPGANAAANQPSAGHGYLHSQEPKEQYTQHVSEQPALSQHQGGYHNSAVVEAPGNSPRAPAELWHGNYRQ